METGLAARAADPTGIAFPVPHLDQPKNERRLNRHHVYRSAFTEHCWPRSVFIASVTRYFSTGIMHLRNTMKTTNTLLTSAVAALAGLLMVAAVAQAEMIQVIVNGGMAFTGGSGDYGGYIEANPSGWGVGTDPGNVAGWSTSTYATVQNPQGIYTFASGSYFVTGGSWLSGVSTWDLYQQVTVGTGGVATLSLEAATRKDGVNNLGTIFIDIYSGSLTSFGNGAPLTATSAVLPTLSSAIQNYSKSYTLAAGTYTVRVGGVKSEGDTFQMGIDNVSLYVPEPASLALLALGGLALFRRRR